MLSKCLTFPAILLRKAPQSTKEKPNVRLTEALAVAPRELASERLDILTMASQQVNGQLDHGVLPGSSASRAET